MRKQYHFRHSEYGLMAWDVSRLIALSADLPCHNVALENIREFDESYWFATGESPTCRAISGHIRLIEAADFRYPIILCAAGRLMDGMHRAMKALLLGRSYILAVQFTQTPEPDYIGIDPETLSYDVDGSF